MNGDTTSAADRAGENEGGRPSAGTARSARGAQPERVRVRRIYDPPAEQDGIRVLVDRLWPRGMSKARAQIDEWCRDVAPSTELRRWYQHDPQRFTEFCRRYRLELESGEQATALHHLTELAQGRTLTLLTASRDTAISEAAVLADFIGRRS